MIRRPPISTRTDTLFPYTTLFRSNRLPTVLNNTSGFVYYVSIMGITGTAAVPRDHVRDAVARLRRHTELPIVAGFGIRTPEQAAAIAGVADGAAVGSAIVDAVKAELEADGKAKPGLAARGLPLVESLAPSAE